MVDRTDALRYVTHGMKVYDELGSSVGKVQFVKLSDDALATEGAHPKGFADQIATFVQTLRDNNIVGEECDQLLRDGFARVNTGLFFSDRYILPDQIEDVTDAYVRLNVEYDDLLS